MAKRGPKPPPPTRIRWAVFWAHEESSRRPRWMVPKLRRTSKTYRTLACAVADLLSGGASLHAENRFCYFFAPFELANDEFDLHSGEAFLTKTRPLMPWAKADAFLRAGHFMREDGRVPLTIQFKRLERLLEYAAGRLTVDADEHYALFNQSAASEAAAGDAELPEEAAG